MCIRNNWGDLDHHANSPNRESQAIWGVMSCLGQGRLRCQSALVLYSLIYSRKNSVFLSPAYVNDEVTLKYKSCQKPTIELAGRLREKLNISPLDIGHE